MSRLGEGWAMGENSDKKIPLARKEKRKERAAEGENKEVQLQA